MMKSEMISGYTKTQALILSSFLFFSGVTFLGITDVTANDLDLSRAVLIGKETIHAPDESMIFLSEDEREEKKEEIREALENTPAVSTTYMTASAYNSVPGQTDGSPFSTAIGSNARDGVIASNYFPIGTKIRIPDHFGNKVFRVEDRMNPRYDKTLDIWMEEISDAKQWGRRYVKVEVVKWGLGRGVE